MKSTIKKHLILILTVVVFSSLTSCSLFGSEPSDPTPTSIEESIAGEEGDPFIGIPNPASFYCEEMGYMLELRETDGGTEGICVMPDGQECEEWEFLAGECAIEWTFCVRQGYSIAAGEEYATCTFPDGSSCPEYDFFIRECQAPEQ